MIGNSPPDRLIHLFIICASVWYLDGGHSKQPVELGRFKVLRHRGACQHRVICKMPADAVILIALTVNGIGQPPKGFVVMEKWIHSHYNTPQQDQTCQKYSQRSPKPPSPAPLLCFFACPRFTGLCLFPAFACFVLCPHIQCLFSRSSF